MLPFPSLQSHDTGSLSNRDCEGEMADGVKTQSQVTGIHITNFISRCLAGGWSGTWRVCAAPFLLGKNNHDGQASDLTLAQPRLFCLHRH